MTNDDPPRARDAGRGNDSGLRDEISSTALHYRDVPDPNGSLEFRPPARIPELIQFAMTMDKASMPALETLEFLATAVRKRWERVGDLPELDLDGYRGCLYYEADYWRHTQSGGRAWETKHVEHAAFLRGLVGAIAKFLCEEESWWWEPEKEPTDEERNRRAPTRSREGEPLIRLYEDASRHLGETIETYEKGLPAEDRVIAEALDPPVLDEDPVLAFRQRTAQRLALAFWLRAEGEGFDRVRAAEKAANEAAYVLRL